MEVVCEIDESRNLVAIRLRGAPDGEIVPGTLERIRKDGRLRPGVLVLTDRRGLDRPPDSVYVAQVVDAMSSLPPGCVERWAILASPGSGYGLARMTELRAGLRGVQIAAFTSEEEARSWLLAGGEAP